MDLLVATAASALRLLGAVLAAMDTCLEKSRRLYYTFFLHFATQLSSDKPCQIDIDDSVLMAARAVGMAMGPFFFAGLTH